MKAVAAEACMTASAWDYTTGDSSDPLSPLGVRALALIRDALRADPQHVLAHHLRIHLLEAQPLLGWSGVDSDFDSADATKLHAVVEARGLPSELLSEAIASADALVALAASPGITGHLLHMPAHAYARVGHWKDAAEVRVHDHLMPWPLVRQRCCAAIRIRCARKLQTNARTLVSPIALL